MCGEWMGSGVTVGLGRMSDELGFIFDRECTRRCVGGGGERERGREEAIGI